MDSERPTLPMPAEKDNCSDAGDFRRVFTAASIVVVVAETTPPKNNQFSMLNAYARKSCFLHAFDERTDANGRESPQGRFL